MSAVGNAWSYIAGQCTAFVAAAATWVPAGWGNAIDWLANAQSQGFQTSQTPVPGAVAVYGQSYSPYGHVALVTAVGPNNTFQVQEQNYQGPGIVDTRTSTNAGVLGFILPPGNGVAMSGPGGQSTDLTAQNIFGQDVGNSPWGLLAPWVNGATGALQGAASGAEGAAAGSVAPIGAGLAAVGQGIASIPTTIGHGLANAVGASAHDVQVWFTRNIIALSVAVVVGYVLFEGMPSAPSSGGPKVVPVPV
jgi:hypothetical protein